MMTALRMQFRVLSALVLRETRTTFGASQAGYVWAIITPSASTTVLVILFMAAGRHAPFGVSLALFFGLGVLTLELFTKLTNALMTVFEANKALLAYPVIKETDVLFARAILIVASYLLIMTIFLAGLMAAGLAGMPTYLEEVLAAFGVTSLLGFGAGAGNAILVSYWESWRHVEKILTRPLFFLSGLFYVPSNLPEQALDWLKWNPVLHCVEWMRHGWYANYDSRVLDKQYLISVTLFIVFLSLLCERLTREGRCSR